MENNCTSEPIPEVTVSPVAEPVAELIPQLDTNLNDRGFIGAVLLLFKVKFDDNDSKSVSILKQTLSEIYYSLELEPIRKNIKEDEKLAGIIRNIHNILTDESTTDSLKLNRILNFIMNYDRPFDI